MSQILKSSSIGDSGCVMVDDFKEKGSRWYLNESFLEDLQNSNTKKFYSLSALEISSYPLLSVPLAIFQGWI